jgi:hypothetical protein
MPHRAQILGIAALAFPLCAVWADQPVKSQTVNGVKVELVEVKRDSPSQITIRWRYHNDTEETRRLTSETSGALDPYRLALNSYVVDDQSQTKYPVAHDSHNDPVSSKNGRPNEFITIYPKATIQTWAKFPVPESVSTVTVVIEGVPPFTRILVPHP